MGKNNSGGHSPEQFPKRDLKTEPLSKVNFHVEEAEPGLWPIFSDPPASFQRCHFTDS